MALRGLVSWRLSGPGLVSQASLTLLPCSPTGGQGDEVARWLLLLTSHRPMEHLTPAGTRLWHVALDTKQPSAQRQQAGTLRRPPRTRLPPLGTRGYCLRGPRSSGDLDASSGRAPACAVASPLASPALGRGHQKAAKGRARSEAQSHRVAPAPRRARRRPACGGCRAGPGAAGTPFPISPQTRERRRLRRGPGGGGC